MKHEKRRAGFTLIEILVVVVIIAILGGFVGVNLVNKPNEARVSKATSQIGVFETALSLYKLDNGNYPTQEQGLMSLVEEPKVDPLPRKYSSDGYLEKSKVPSDPWGSEYIYLIPGSNGEKFEIISYGADGQPGGEEFDADISSSNIE
ncbi:MAG: type II secretion system major pseudopilin GspG [Kiritimatiellae bacterium]|jgi:general secretion pathway protein G|nr:type II secretion system major pseudopilin GspG [Kiritimatiellia bacterium]